MLIQNMAARKHLIKKYANRKLYDTQTSRYITLEGISKLVRDGHEIEVVERDSGRDLTPLVLSQIVVGEEKRGPDGTSDTLQDRGQALFDYVRRTLSGPASKVSSRVERGRSDLEELVDMAVERALIRLSIPTRKDVEALVARLDQLESQLSLQTPRKAARKTAPTTSRTRRAARAR
jgi:PHB/PHA accumulation regulator DNA-binding domain/Poly(hydroxyalcanoate) granule associated protein (phasin)